MALATRTDTQGWSPAVTPDLLRAEKSTALLKSRGKVMFHSKFDGGTFDGWRDHQGGNAQTPCNGLTRYPVKSGTHALQLSTGAVPYQSGLLSSSTSAYKNLTLPRDTGVVSLSGWFAHGGESDEVSGTGVAYYGWGISMDIQNFLDTDRGFFQIQFVDTGGGTNPQQLCLIDPNTGALTVVTGSGHVLAGENENKWNFNYLRLTARIGSGQWKFLEAQVNSTLFDLTGYTLDPTHPVQAGSSSKSFAGGFNAGINLSRSVATRTNYIHNVLVADDLVMTFGDVLA